jgi:hypothetical protein
MGGNLFKVQRVSRERYMEILEALEPILFKHFLDEKGFVHWRIPIPYSGKDNFGDVDIILNASYLQNKDWIPALLADLGNPEVKRVRNVVSVLFMDFQVDFFTVGESKFDTTFNFMSYNILGNLLGRIFHKFNLCYGEHGLSYILRGFDNHGSKEVMLSRDMEEILKFIELDTLEDIYKYVVDCKYFCANSYDPTYFNVRKRAAQRPAFNQFLDYLSENKIEKNYEFMKDKSVYIPLIDAFFPAAKLAEKVKAHEERQKILKVIAEKFNGRMIMEMIPLSGKELGNFMDAYKKAKGDDFETFVYKSNPGLVQHSVKTYYSLVYLKQNSQNLV